MFQQSRRIDLTDDRALSGWTLQEPLRLLDLASSDWALRNSAAHMLTAAPRSTCRAWARAIHNQLGNRIDGILTPSTITGDPVVVVFDSGGRCFPTAPDFSRSLEHVDVHRAALRAGDRFGWRVVQCRARTSACIALRIAPLGDRFPVPAVGAPECSRSTREPVPAAASRRG